MTRSAHQKGKIRIEDGDESTFVAERAEEPDEPIQEPPSYQDKWRRTRAVVHQLSSSIPPRRHYVGWPLLRLAP